MKKDWESKIEKDRYDNKKNVSSIWFHPDYQNKKGKVWVVHLMDKFYTHSTKIFKTKSQSLKFVRDYMKRN
jgi:hypothetical protein